MSFSPLAINFSFHSKSLPIKLISAYESSDLLSARFSHFFLPPTHVSNAFDALDYELNSYNLPPESTRILAYFKRTYFVRPNGNRPFFAVATWNHYERAGDMLSRTNNAQ